MKSSQQVALITGANKGLGLEIARQLGQKGLVVVLGARQGTSPLRVDHPFLTKSRANKLGYKSSPCHLFTSSNSIYLNLFRPTLFLSGGVSDFGSVVIG